MNYMERLSEAHRRHEREVVEQRFPALKLARTLAEAVGLSSAEHRQIELAIAILHSEGMANPFDRSVYACYQEVKALLATTDAPLQEFRAWFGRIAASVE